MKEALRKPTEDVSWEQVAAAVPGEAATFEAALSAEEISMSEFCRDWPEFLLGKLSYSAWERLSKAFRLATGLEVEPHWRRIDEDSDDTVDGLHVVGAWQLSPTGKRFFGIKDENICSAGEYAVEATSPKTKRRRCDVGWDEPVDCIRLDPDDDLVETVLIEQNSSLLGQDDRSHELPIRIAMESGVLQISARGYGNAGMQDGYGDQVCLEVYDGEFRVHVFPDIFEECPLTLSLEGAKEEWRARKVTIQVRRATAEGQAQTVGTVAVPDGTTDEEIKRLFWEWQDLVTDEASDPDEGDEADVSRPCEPAADSKFIAWLVEKHGFRHAKEPGEILTLLW